MTIWPSRRDFKRSCMVQSVLLLIYLVISCAWWSFSCFPWKNLVFLHVHKGLVCTWLPWLDCCFHFRYLRSILIWKIPRVASVLPALRAPISAASSNASNTTAGQWQCGLYSLIYVRPIHFYGVVSLTVTVKIFAVSNSGIPCLFAYFPDKRFDRLFFGLAS